MPDKYIVPQFIDKEDQILGPITVRQFLIMLVAMFVIFIAYRLLVFEYFIVVAIFVSGIAGIIAFVKMNGQPFHIFFINFLQTNLRPMLRIWDKRPTDGELRAWISESHVMPVGRVSTMKQKPERSRLRDLSLVVNTGGVYRPEDDAF